MNSLSSAPFVNLPQSQPSAFKVGSLFAAIGGFCRAFQEAGATVACANEKDRFAAETFKLNHPSVRFLHKPFEDLSVEGDGLEPVDIFTGGFPCQPFSVAGEKHGFQDERGMLCLHIIRIIREFGSKGTAEQKRVLLKSRRRFHVFICGGSFCGFAPVSFGPSTQPPAHLHCFWQ